MQCLQVDRPIVRYQRRRVDDLELREAIKCVSREQGRFGFRRIYLWLGGRVTW